jgi:hypothetical protein
MTKARDIADFKFENITDTGTEGTRVATGTTAQRGSTAGQLRFNSTTGLAEYYTGTEFKSIDTPPIITSIDVTNVATDLGGTETFVITGSLFNGSATVKFRDNGGTLITPDTTTVNSASQITVTKTRSSFSNANEPYDVIVTNPSGLEATLDNQVNVDNSPVWSTASGSLGSINDNVSANLSVSATDPDGDTVEYSVQSGSLPVGTSLNSSTGAITGDPTDVASDTTSNFTLRATANNNTADRAFSITVVHVPLGLTSSDGITSLSGASSFVPNDGDVAVRYFRNSADTASYLLPVKNVSGTLNWLMPMGSTSYTEDARTVSGSTYWFDSSYYTDQSFGLQGAQAWTVSGTTLTSNGGTGANANEQQVVRKINLGINFRYFSVDNMNATGYGSSSADWSNTTDPSGSTMDLGNYSDSVGIIVGKSGSYANGNPFSHLGNTNGNRTASRAEEDLGYNDATELALYASGDTSAEYYSIHSGTILFRI